MIPNFAFAGWLLALVLIPLLALGYWLVQRLKRQRAIAFGNTAVLASVLPRRGRLLQALPGAALLVALGLLVVAIAAPMGDVRVPRNRATVMLVVDVSISMESTDVAPTRLEAAQIAATDFANSLTPGINLGLITFAGTASVLVSPTTRREPVTRALSNLQLAERTATGEAIFSALQSINTFAEAFGDENTDGEPIPAHIVLLSDGAQTVPEDPDAPRGANTAAQAASAAGVPVSTISFGTVGGTISYEGVTQPVPVDDASLEHIAQVAGGNFYSASSLDELSAVYSDLEEQIGFETVQEPNSRPWLIAGTGVLLLAAIGSLLIHRRLP